MSEPCWYCGTRGDIGCRHQPAEGEPPAAITTPIKPDGRRERDTNGTGRNFHGIKRGDIQAAIARLVGSKGD